jgi:hypothetical protein
LKPKNPEVIAILDDDEQKNIIDLFSDDEQDLKHLTKSIFLETEKGKMVQKQTEEEEYWK